MSASLKRIFPDLLFRNQDQHAIPNMDGNLSPNARLDEAREIACFDTPPDHFVIDRDHNIFLAVGDTIQQAKIADSIVFSSWKTLSGLVGGLCFDKVGNLLACVSGKGVVKINPDGQETWLREVDGRPLVCATSITVTEEGTIFLTEGSSDHLPADWAKDLMEGNKGGRLIRCDHNLKDALTIRGNLAYPNGSALARDGENLLYTESWAHTLTRCDQNGGAIHKVAPNLPGYPARVSAADDGSYWLGIFAVRTHLVELVLDDQPFKTQMMREIEPRYWIAPSLKATNSYMEPLQGGGVKKLGIIKPWAPPRSYGLALRLDEHGEILESLHSRVGGNCHGITAVQQHEGQVYILSKGHQRLIVADAGGIAP